MQLSFRIDWWTPATAAALIGCTPDHVRWLLRRGDLTGVLERRRWWVSPESCRAYVARRARERAAVVREGAVHGS